MSPSSLMLAIILVIYTYCILTSNAQQPNCPSTSASVCLLYTTQSTCTNNYCCHWNPGAPGSCQGWNCSAPSWTTTCAAITTKSQCTATTNGNAYCCVYIGNTHFYNYGGCFSYWNAYQTDSCHSTWQSCTGSSAIIPTESQCNALGSCCQYCSSLGGCLATYTVKNSYNNICPAQDSCYPPSQFKAMYMTLSIGGALLFLLCGIVIPVVLQCKYGGSRDTSYNTHLDTVKMNEVTAIVTAQIYDTTWYSCCSSWSDHGAPRALFYRRLSIIPLTILACGGVAAMSIGIVLAVDNSYGNNALATNCANAPWSPWYSYP